MIGLINDTIDNKDIDRLVEWLKTYPRLTKGELTLELEKRWSEWLGTKYTLYVNSGSSANLLMLYALKYSKLLKNDKIVVPALSWATDLAPVIQLGLTPLLADINYDNLSVHLYELEQLFIKENPAALLLVSVLGIPPKMKRIVELCEKYDVILLEDNCESMGSKYNGVKLGNFGLMSSFSLYFGHHISTIEGGLISTNDEELYNLLLMLRSHGWDRDLNKKEQDRLKEKYEVSDFKSKYKFYVPGFNLRATDLQAFIGLKQLDKLEDIIEKRNNNYNKFVSFLEDEGLWHPRISDEHFVSSFCIPIISHNNIDNLVKSLNEEGIDNRPLIAGSMSLQPMYYERYGKISMPRAEYIDANGIYIPNHPGLTDNDIDFMCKVIKKSLI